MLANSQLLDVLTGMGTWFQHLSLFSLGRDRRGPARQGFDTSNIQLSEALSLLMGFIYVL